MISIRLYLDTRSALLSGAYPLKLAITKNRKAAYVPLGVTLHPEQWSKEAQCVLGNGAEAAATNRLLLAKRSDVSIFVHDLETSGEAASLTAAQIRDRVVQFLSPAEDTSSRFLARFRDFVSRQQKRRTVEIYEATLTKLLAFDRHAERLTFGEIDKAWLGRFDAWLPSSGCKSRNARNIHLRNIRAVFNDAIDNEVTTAYPFRRFSIKPEATAKRAASVEQLRALFSYPVAEWQQHYVDAFRLIFCLIGINVVDLLAAAPPVRGRVEYNRAKTGRFYSIKVEPEAEELIARYAGKRGHLVCWGEGLKNYRSFTDMLDRELKRIGEVGEDGVLVPAFPSFSSYVARHSWASVAAQLDIPKETIAHALGHGGSSVTDVYIDFDMRKVDEANRRVLDWVFYGKR